jgi:hypothetical protein
VVVFSHSPLPVVPGSKIMSHVFDLVHPPAGRKAAKVKSGPA